MKETVWASKRPPKNSENITFKTQKKKRNQNKQSATGQQTASYTREKAHGENADKKGTMEFQQIYYSQYFSLCET